MKFRSIVKFITISLFEYTAHGIKSLTILKLIFVLIVTDYGRRAESSPAE